MTRKISDLSSFPTTPDTHLSLFPQQNRTRRTLKQPLNQMNLLMILMVRGLSVFQQNISKTVFKCKKKCTCIPGCQQAIRQKKRQIISASLAVEISQNSMSEITGVLIVTVILPLTYLKFKKQPKNKNHQPLVLQNFMAK